MQDQQHNLISRFLSGEASKKEKAMLQAWLEASPENKVYFEQGRQIWEEAGATHRMKAFDVNQSWAEFEQLRKVRFSHKGARTLPLLPRRLGTRTVLHWRYVILAAMVVLTLLAGFRVYEQLTTANQIIMTANGKRMQTTLPDGSITHINYDSRIEVVDFGRDERRVHLRGEAYFEVTPDSMPFIVETNNARIQVLGTKFNVWSRQRGTRVVVTEGRVSLASRGEVVVLGAGQMGMCRAGKAPESLNQVNTDTHIGWITGKLVFEQTPLAEIIAELQRYYDATIVLEGKDIAHLTITGTFENRSLEMVLKSICLTLELSYTVESQRYIISAPKQ